MMRKIKNDIQNIGEPVDGIFPDSRRIIKSIHAEKKTNGKRIFPVEGIFGTGKYWIPEQDLPELIIAEYDALKIARLDD